MSQDSQVLVTTTNDIARLNHLLVGNSITGFRNGIQKAQQRIVTLEKTQTELRLSESHIKSRLYSTLDQAFIYSHTGGGTNTRADWQSSYEQQIKEAGTDPSINHDKFQTYLSIHGVSEMEQALNKINNELMQIDTAIREYSLTIVSFQTAIKSAEEARSKNILYKAGSLVSSVGNYLSPDQSDIEQDAIAKSNVSGLLLLQGLSKAYNMYSTDQEGKRAYPDEAKLAATTMSNIRKHFWAHAQSYPEFLQENTKLDFNDPGCEQNLKIIKEKLDTFRGAAANTKIVDVVDQFIKNIVTVVNDSSISDGISKKAETILPEGTSLKDKTIHYPSVVMSLGDTYYYGSFECPTWLAGLKKSLQEKNTKFLPLPLCPKIVRPPDTSKNLKSDQVKDKYEEAKNAGAQKFRDALAAATNFQKTINASTEGLVGELPIDAPDWVYNYTSIFESNDFGTISYPLDRLPAAKTTTSSATGANVSAPSASSDAVPVSDMKAPASSVLNTIGDKDPSKPVDTKLPLTPASIPVFTVAPSSSTNVKITNPVVSTGSNTGNSPTANPTVQNYPYANILNPSLTTPSNLETWKANALASATNTKPGALTTPATPTPTTTVEQAGTPPPATEGAKAPTDAFLLVTRGTDNNKDGALNKAQKIAQKNSPNNNPDINLLDKYAYKNANGTVIAFMLWRS